MEPSPWFPPVSFPDAAAHDPPSNNSSEPAFAPPAVEAEQTTPEPEHVLSDRLPSSPLNSSSACAPLPSSPLPSSPPLCSSLPPCPLQTSEAVPPGRAPDSYTSPELESVLRQFVTVDSLKSLSRKNARNGLEKRLGLAEDSLKFRREEINVILTTLVSEIGPVADQKTEESTVVKRARESGAEEEGEDAPKHAKPSAADEPPKGLKKLQSTLMSKESFLSDADTLKSFIGPLLQFEMKPRRFAPGSCGWYWGGKVQMPCGDKMIWCQMGVNCSVLGSKEWPESFSGGNR